ncbi:MAG TPA: myo-inosose-2 dehydratase [Burkholderiales bacterium]|nr:myo-inosose-2 dehydratase [Burkholderiales bacterium]
MSTKAFDVKIGINPISWANDDLPELGGDTPLETILSEGSEIGYQGFELGNKFPKKPAALRKVLAQYGVELVSGWYSGELARRSVEEEIQAVGPHLQLLAKNGANVMVYGEVADSIQGKQSVALSRRPQFAGDAQWHDYAKKLDAFARYTLSQGIGLAYHHHMGAYVETVADVDRLMSLTGPGVGLLLDSGHIAFAGGDPVDVLKRHIARVCHVHCKDVRPAVAREARRQDWSFLDSVLKGVFTVPGDGNVDFKSLLQVLYYHDYRGWLVVEAEQDPALAPSYQYAQMGFRHLSELKRALER